MVCHSAPNIEPVNELQSKIEELGNGYFSDDCVRRYGGIISKLDLNFNFDKSNSRKIKTVVPFADEDQKLADFGKKNLLVKNDTGDFVKNSDLDQPKQSYKDRS